MFLNPASALIVLVLLLAASTSRSGSIGINLQDSNTGGAVVTSTAFGIDSSSWFNLSPGGGGSEVLDPVNGGQLEVAWSTYGTWYTTYSDGVAGDDQVYHGWAEFDPWWNSAPLPGQYYLTISGLNSAFPNGCVVQAVAADDNCSSFQPVTLTNGVQTLSFSAWAPFADAPLGGVSTVSTVITDDVVRLEIPQGAWTAPGGYLQAGTLAGILLRDPPQPSLDFAVNFQENNTGLVGKQVTETAFGVPVDNWINMTPGGSGSESRSVPGGGSVAVTWSAGNWNSVYTDGQAGNEEVYYGWLDFGWGANASYVAVSGLNAIFTNGYVVQVAASTDDGQGLQPVTLNGVDNLTFSASRSPDGPLGGLSTVSGTRTDDTLFFQIPDGTVWPNRASISGIIFAGAPLIQTPPQSASLTVGQALNLSVFAIGPDLSYRWRRAGVTISGATNAAYNVANAATGDSGNYDVVIANAYGSITSSIAAVTVNEQLTGTVLTFDGYASDTPVPDSFGDNVTASTTGITVISNGTPDINLAWAATGDAGTEWEFYNDGVWSAAQLNSCDVGEYYDLHFAPSNNASVVIQSFKFHGYYNDNERFTFGMEIWDNGDLLTNWSYTFLSDGTKDHEVNVNFKGQPGHELVLSFNRNASTLGGGEVEGDPYDIAVDDVNFSEIPPVVVVFSGRTWTPLIQVASAQYSPPQTNEYAALDANTGIMTGRFGVDTAMTTPLTLGVGDTVSYDYFVSSESRNFRGTGASTYFGDTGTGFQDGSGNWVGDRNVRYYGSTWEDYLIAPGGGTDGYVYQSRGSTQVTHVKWTFPSATTAIVTLVLDGETVPYATWTNTLSDISNIQQFRVGLYDSEQDVTLANFTVSPFSAHAAIVGFDAPEALWRLDEGGGSIAYDSTGRHNAAYTGTLTYGVSGAFLDETAVSFDGASGYAAVPYTAALNPQGPFSVEAWVKPAIVPNSSGTPAPLSSAQFTSNRSGWQIRERDTGWQFVLYTHSGSTVADAVLANTSHGGVPSTNSWTHLVGVYDGVNAVLYVNGVAYSTTAPGYVANYNDGVNAAGPFTIGARSSLDNFFQGGVDDVVFYGRALTETEVQSHYLDRPRLGAGASGGDLNLTWPVGTLQEADNVEGPYTDVSGATSPYTIPMTADKKFYRIKL